MTRQDYAKLAIETLGGVSKTARLANTSKQNVNNWRLRGIPLHYVRVIANHTPYTAEKLIYGD